MHRLQCKNSGERASGKMGKNPKFWVLAQVPEPKMWELEHTYPWMSSFKNNFCYSTIFPILDRCVKLEKERKLASSSTDVHPKICHEFFKLRNSNLLAASKILLAFFCVLFVVKTFWKMDLGSDNFRNEK